MSPQQQFDQQYVSSSELCTTLGVSRSSLANLRAAGGLPGAIEVMRPDGGVHVVLWLREHVRPHVDAYRARLARRRGGAAA